MIVAIKENAGKNGFENIPAEKNGSLFKDAFCKLLNNLQAGISPTGQPVQAEKADEELPPKKILPENRQGQAASAQTASFAGQELSFQDDLPPDRSKRAGNAEPMGSVPQKKEKEAGSAEAGNRRETGPDSNVQASFVLVPALFSLFSQAKGDDNSEVAQAGTQDNLTPEALTPANAGKVPQSPVLTYSAAVFPDEGDNLSVKPFQTDTPDRDGAGFMQKTPSTRTDPNAKAPEIPASAMLFTDEAGTLQTKETGNTGMSAGEIGSYTDEPRGSAAARDVFKERNAAFEKTMSVDCCMKDSDDPDRLQTQKDGFVNLIADTNGEQSEKGPPPNRLPEPDSLQTKKEPAASALKNGERQTKKANADEGLNRPEDALKKSFASKTDAALPNENARILTGDIAAAKEAVSSERILKTFPQPVFDQLSGNVLGALKEKRYTFDMKLYPEGLGQISVKLVCENGAVSLDILTHSKETQKLLFAQVDELKSTLAANNYEVLKLNVNHGGGGETAADGSFFSSGYGASDSNRGNEFSKTAFEYENREKESAESADQAEFRIGIINCKV